jgi:5-methylcytosine-specific restriction enzyme A
MKIEVCIPSEIVPFFEIATDRGVSLIQKITGSFADSPELIPEKTEVISERLVNFDSDIFNDCDEFPEGAEKTILHKVYERNPKVIKEKKRDVLKDKGMLRCEICDFDFADVYGEYGYGFAECHHTIPVHQLTPDHKTTKLELAIVCSNCHRILHRSRPLMLTVEELRKFLFERKKSEYEN